MKQFKLSSLLLLLFALPAAVWAHHGWSTYGSEAFTLTGTVEQVFLGYPHGQLQIRADGKLWHVVLGPPQRNTRAGLVEEAVPVGTTVTVSGRRHRDPDRLEIKTERLETGGQRFDIYPERL